MKEAMNIRLSPKLPPKNLIVICSVVERCSHHIVGGGVISFLVRRDSVVWRTLDEEIATPIFFHGDPRAGPEWR